MFAMSCGRRRPSWRVGLVPCISEPLRSSKNSKAFALGGLERALAGWTDCLKRTSCRHGRSACRRLQQALDAAAAHCRRSAYAADAGSCSTPCRTAAGDSWSPSFKLGGQDARWRRRSLCGVRVSVACLLMLTCSSVCLPRSCVESIRTTWQINGAPCGRRAGLRCRAPSRPCPMVAGPCSFRWLLVPLLAAWRCAGAAAQVPQGRHRTWGDG